MADLVKGTKELVVTSHVRIYVETECEAIFEAFRVFSGEVSADSVVRA